MIECSTFVTMLKEQDISFYTGVPDSLLKSFCAYVGDTCDPRDHVIAANEGGAVALAMGHHLATGTIPVVYMQNSGQGNALNPLLSLADSEVNGIPMLLVVGWRGEPGKHDEPQHIKQGKVTLSLFDTIDLPYEVLSENQEDAQLQLKRVLELARRESCPVALIVKKDTFAPYTKQNKHKNTFTATREEAIREVVRFIPENSVIVSSTGHISRELYELLKSDDRKKNINFRMVGGMGHASQVALGIALAKPDVKVYCFDGDGAVLMHLGGLPIIGQSRCPNLTHIIFNNGAHGSVGGQPTVAHAVSLKEIATASGYSFAQSCGELDSVSGALEEAYNTAGPSFIEMSVALGNRKDLGRPKEHPRTNTAQVVTFLNNG